GRVAPRGRLRGRRGSRSSPSPRRLLRGGGRGAGPATALKPTGPPIPLAGEALLAGFYLNELCLRLLAAHDPQPEVFLLYAAALAKPRDAADIAPPLRHFELGLLEAIGYGLNLTVDVASGETVSASEKYLFQPDSGPRHARGGHDQQLISGASLLAMAAGRLEEAQVLRDAQRILRGAIDRLLNGRPLKSREVLRDIYSRKRRTGGD